MLGAFGFSGPTAVTFLLGRIVVEFAFRARPVAFVDGVRGTEVAVGSGCGVGNGKLESMDRGGTGGKERNDDSIEAGTHN